MDKRIPHVNGIRGFLLTMMTINHFGDLWGPSSYNFFNHHTVFFVADAPFFFFLSGFLLGYRYLEKFYLDPMACTIAIFRKAIRIYLYFAIPCSIIMLNYFFYKWNHQNWDELLGGIKYLEASDAFLYSLLMLMNPAYCPILPQYVIYFAFSPIAFWLFKKRLSLLLLLTIFAIWISANFGYSPITFAKAAFRNPLMQETGSFNYFAWQLPFFLGMISGYLTSQKYLPVRIFFHRYNVLAAAMALTLVALVKISSHYYEFDFIHLHFINNRINFSLLFLVNSALIIYLGAWLLFAVCSESKPMVLKISHFAKAFFSFSLFTYVGKRSLQVFSYHVFSIYGAAMAWDHSELHPYSRDLLMTLIILSNCIPVFVYDRYLRKRALVQKKGSGTNIGDSVVCSPGI